jgi:nicotinate-nucleotide pyrophosphorylase (carboxylating)
MYEYLSSSFQQWLAEDLGDGDHTTLSCIPAEATGQSRLIVKEPGIIAGVGVAHALFLYVDPDMQFIEYISDGSEVKPGDIVFEVTGKVHSLLKTERLMLNIMQRMSGISTTTHRYVKALEGTHTHVLDTRKTTPGMRLLEKEAVRLGGGMNHRIGLYDMILLKDNHIDFAGGIEKAIHRVHEYLRQTGKSLKIEIEVRSLNELDQVLALGGVDRIMLDNFSIELTQEAVHRIGGRFEIESSGGITSENLRQYAECGVDYISVGALTHSVKSLDLSFKAC